MTDKINPEYYKRGGLESIEVMERKLTEEQFIGALKGNQYKYWDRRGFKQSDSLSDIEKLENRIEECDKQIWYTEREKKVYLDKLAKLKSSPVMPDEWIEDSLHDED